MLIRWVKGGIKRVYLKTPMFKFRTFLNTEIKVGQVDDVVLFGFNETLGVVNVRFGTGEEMFNVSLESFIEYIPA
jgi:hypothetical protein